MFLSPLIILTIPSLALLGQNGLITVLVAMTGLAGTMSGKKMLSLLSSLSLLILLVWGKVATTILKTGSQDTALLLVEFIAVLVFMEASSATLAFSKDYSKLKTRDDEFSQVLRVRLQQWLRSQFVAQSKLALVTLGLSIGLLTVAGFTSVSINQLAISATLALSAIIILLFLLTHTREPEAR